VFKPCRARHRLNLRSFVKSFQCSASSTEWEKRVCCRIETLRAQTQKKQRVEPIYRLQTKSIPFAWLMTLSDYWHLGSGNTARGTCHIRECKDARDGYGACREKEVMLTEKKPGLRRATAMLCGDLVYSVALRLSFSSASLSLNSHISSSDKFFFFL